MSRALAPRVRALLDAGRRWRPARGDTWPDLLFVPVAVLLLGTYFSVVNPYFLTEFNLTNLFVQGSILALVAFGVTFVILSGEFDLSVGSGVALASVVAAFVMRDTGSLALGFAVAMAVGCAIGVINGLIVTRLEVPVVHRYVRDADDRRGNRAGRDRRRGRDRPAGRHQRARTRGVPRRCPGSSGW